jgi:hypothetical protein
MHRRIHVQEENVVIGQTMTSRLILAVRTLRRVSESLASIVENAAHAVIKKDPQ